ncbi:hypothetical protein GCM10027610_113060 [Dactylosporangium cerinum]
MRAGEGGRHALPLRLVGDDRAGQALQDLLDEVAADGEVRLPVAGVGGVDGLPVVEEGVDAFGEGVAELLAAGPDGVAEGVVFLLGDLADRGDGVDAVAVEQEEPVLVVDVGEERGGPVDLDDQGSPPTNVPWMPPVLR